MNCPYCGVAFNMWVKNHPECEENAIIISFIN